MKQSRHSTEKRQEWRQDELSVTFLHTAGKVTISLHLSAPVGQMVMEMPISTTEMGQNT